MRDRRVCQAQRCLAPLLVLIENDNTLTKKRKNSKQETPMDSLPFSKVLLSSSGLLSGTRDSLTPHTQTELSDYS